jgi:hypothetical protein
LETEKGAADATRRAGLSGAEYTFRVSGDTAVRVVTPKGEEYSIRYIGIGHPWHTIGPDGGRVATDAEYALAKALIAERAS